MPYSRLAGACGHVSCEVRHVHEKIIRTRSLYQAAKLHIFIIFRITGEAAIETPSPYPGRATPARTEQIGLYTDVFPFSLLSPPWLGGKHKHRASQGLHELRTQKGTRYKSSCTTANVQPRAACTTRGKQPAQRLNFPERL